MSIHVAYMLIPRNLTHFRAIQNMHPSGFDYPPRERNPSSSSSESSFRRLVAVKQLRSIIHESAASAPMPRNCS
jgi:hypothetical protein